MFRKLCTYLTLLYLTYAQITFTQFPPDTIYLEETYITSWTLPQNQSVTESKINLCAVGGDYEPLDRSSADDREFIWTVSPIFPDGDIFYLRVESTYSNGTVVGGNTPTFVIGEDGFSYEVKVILIIIIMISMCGCFYGVSNLHNKYANPRIPNTPTRSTPNYIYIAPTCATYPPPVSSHTCATDPPPVTEHTSATEPPPVTEHTCATEPPPTPEYMCATNPSVFTSIHSSPVIPATPVYSVTNQFNTKNSEVMGIVIE